jgi:hypothetical protein
VSAIAAAVSTGAGAAGAISVVAVVSVVSSVVSLLPQEATNRPIARARIPIFTNFMTLIFLVLFQIYSGKKKR